MKHIVVWAMCPTLWPSQDLTLWIIVSLSERECTLLMQHVVHDVDGCTLQDFKPLGLLGNLHPAPITDLAWSPDGRFLVVSSRDGYCRCVARASFYLRSSPVSLSQRHSSRRFFVHGLGLPIQLDRGSATTGKTLFTDSEAQATSQSLSIMPPQHMLKGFLNA